MKKGFTLLEVLVVVMILGVLASMAMAQYNRSVRRAEMLEGLSHGRSILDSALRYKSANGNPPTEFNQLDIGFIGTDITDNVFDDGNFTYTLNTNNVTVQSNKGFYSLVFVFPIINTTGVYAPIACCPQEGKTDAIWLCKNISGSQEESTSTGMPTGCWEIK